MKISTMGPSKNFLRSWQKVPMRGIERRENKNPPRRAASVADCVMKLHASSVKSTSQTMPMSSFFLACALVARRWNSHRTGKLRVSTKPMKSRTMKMGSKREAASNGVVFPGGSGSGGIQV